MIINVKNKDTLIIGEFKFKCCIGKGGFTNKKIEGDKKTPRGTFSLGKVFFRSDRIEDLPGQKANKKVAFVFFTTLLNDFPFSRS